MINWGVNLSGLGFTNMYGSVIDYGCHPRYNAATATGNTDGLPEDFDILGYYKGKGMTIFRLPFMWERLQPVLGGNLDPTYLAYIRDVVNGAAAHGVGILLDLHNYGHYPHDGSAVIQPEWLAEIWTRLANEFRGHSGVWGYGLMNEPQSMASTLAEGKLAWFKCAQAAITAIRAVDVITPITIGGYEWSNATRWPVVSDNLAALVGTNLIYEAHRYLGYPTSTSCAIPAAGAINPETWGPARFSPFVEWLRSSTTNPHRRKGLIGEFGICYQPFWLDVCDHALAYLASARDVLASVQIFAAGPWWPYDPVYQWDIDPRGAAIVDSPQMALLSKYIRDDLDGNGKVDAADLTLAASMFGGTGAADFNADGIVDILDLITLVQKFT